MPVCSIRSCKQSAVTDGLCEAHLRKRELNGGCIVAGCGKPISRPALGWCEMHFYRHRRHGSVHHVRTANVLRKVDRGYVLLHMPDHPLAVGRWVYEHRYVAYEVFGPGPQECWWCGVQTRWDADLNVDHLDYDRSNNAAENLVISCRPCNIGRGAGCDKEGWAISIATRRVLRRHQAEFRSEVELIKARLEAVPAHEHTVSERQKTVQAGYAARSVYRENVPGDS